MLLNLFAIFVFFAVLATVIGLLWRRLPRAGDASAGELLCGSCGTPASRFAIDAFICPVCGKDARELGLIAKKSAAAAGPFRLLLVFTAILNLLALVCTVALTLGLQRDFIVSNDVQRWSDGKTTYHVDLDAAGIRDRKGGPLAGEADGDIVSADGELITLQVHSPSLRYEIVNDAGRIMAPSSGGAFEEQAVLQWLAAAKLDPADPLVRWGARESYEHLCGTLKLTPAPPSVPQPHMRSLSSSSGGSLSSFSTVAPALLPFSLIGWSIGWLIGVLLILARARHKTTCRVLEQEAAA